jgi:hypothetical protein
MALKTDLSTLKRSISLSQAAEQSTAAKQRADYEASRKLEAESHSAICTMLLAARLKDIVTDFPDRIDLSNPNGYRAGYALEFRDGIWHVVLSDGVPYYDGGLDYSIGGFSSKAVKAMGIDVSPSSVHAVNSLMKFDASRLAGELSGAFRFLPRHTAVSVFGGGWKLAQAIGFADRDEAAVAFAEAALELKANYSAKPTEGRPHILARLANNNDSSFFEAAVEICGAKVNERCLFAAVDERATDLVVWIIGRGVSPDSRDVSGDTALHRAIRRITHKSEIESVKRVVKALIAAGVPVLAENRHNATARRTLESYVGDMDREDMFDYEREALAELEEILSV